jgi:hypothetical protein
MPSLSIAVTALETQLGSIVRTVARVPQTLGERRRLYADAVLDSVRLRNQ